MGVIDPANPQPGDSLDPGSRLVAVNLTVKDVSPNPEQGDVNGDSTLLDTQGIDISVAFDDVTNCSNFNYGSYSLTPGGAAFGCVIFDVPDGEALGQFQFEQDFGLKGDFTLWTLR